MADVVLSINGITKSFAGNKVLDDINLEIQRGSVHALVGENGAGKSTLVKIVGGIYQPDSGTICMNGKTVHFAGPHDAINHGISIVHQELSLVPKMSIAQNVFSHREPVNRLGFIKWAELYRKTRELLKPLGLDIDPGRPVGGLSVGVQQLIEIAKALSTDARVLILDEPTSALSEKEVDMLYKVINDLKSRGVTSIFISHKLPEVFRVSDVISVLRDGRLVGTVRKEATTPEEIIRMMVGRPLGDLYPPKSSRVGERILSVENMTRVPAFRDVSLELFRGEILGFAGLVGSGRTEVARAIFGADRIDSGRIMLGGREVKIGSPRDAIRHGICYLTEDRKDLGLFLTKTVRSNIVASSLSKFVTRNGFLRKHEIEESSRYFVDYFRLKPSDDRALVMNLSGGNQQKALLAKWICAGPKVLIADEPTRGVDVGAKSEIHRHLRQLAESGVGVIVISSELPELLGLSDRIAVFNSGRIAAFIDGKGATQEDVMRYATL
ncbi:MAG TPA: sugar ABC transporter ATP-binding protein [Firmicutes bacterium]|nr:sugar ABC transporter ATP-binding protein [Bacillota bacterium]